MHFRIPGELTPVTSFPVKFIAFLVTVAMVYGMTGCIAVKNPPINKPFVYETNVSVSSKELNKEQKTIMEEKLITYIDDSLAIRAKYILGFKQRVSPALFDSAYIPSSVRFMNGYLNSEGYYNARLDTFTVKVDTFPTRKASSPKSWFMSKEKMLRHRQLRVTTSFAIDLGKSLKVDSIAYFFWQPELQKLADSVKSKALLSRNTPYTKQILANELDKLAVVFRDHGFFRMGRYALQAEVDTTDPSLVSLDMDPLEQIMIAQKRRENPTISLRITQRPGIDSSIFRPYIIDSIFIYPDVKVTDDIDSLMVFKKFNEKPSPSKVIIRERQHLFLERMLRKNNLLVPGTRYNEKQYFKTLNNYSQMGPWQQLDVQSRTFRDSIDRVKLHLFLYPAKRQSFQLDLEGSQNNNISVDNVLSGRYFAISVNGTYRSRNVLKRGTQSTTSGRVGLEVNNARTESNNNLFQAFIWGLNQSFSLPRLVWPFRKLDDWQIDAKKTSINLGALYTDRFEFYTQTSLNANLTWEVRKKKNSFSFSLPNFESVTIVSTDSLDQLLAENPALQYSFADGNVLSTRFAFERALTYRNKPKWSGFFRLASEITLPGDYQIFNKDFFKFFRLEGLYVNHIQKRNSSIDYRLYTGVGWDLTGRPGATLPYFRQFVAGGSNSMRAWGLRQLGIGNSIAYDTASYPDRFGDIQLELNFEYRFKLFRMFGFNFSGVGFADIGNIWNHSPAADGNGQFQFKYLYRDLAMAVGTGIRWDLSFLIIRLDAGYKVKDPVREGAGWMDTFEWKSANRLGTERKSNVGVQFGIGYPF